jgi:hypothetical protein
MDGVIYKNLISVFVMENDWQYPGITVLIAAKSKPSIVYYISVFIGALQDH